MPRLPMVSGREAISALQKAGFAVVSQEGSHVKLKKPGPTRTLIVIVPVHPELARKTLSSILRQANLSAEEFNALL